MPFFGIIPVHFQVDRGVSPDSGVSTNIAVSEGLASPQRPLTAFKEITVQGIAGRGKTIRETTCYEVINGKFKPLITIEQVVDMQKEHIPPEQRPCLLDIKERLEACLGVPLCAENLNILQSKDRDRTVKDIKELRDIINKRINVISNIRLIKHKRKNANIKKSEMADYKKALNAIIKKTADFCPDFTQYNEDLLEFQTYSEYQKILFACYQTLNKQLHIFKLINEIEIWFKSIENMFNDMQKEINLLRGHEVNIVKSKRKSPTTSVSQ